MAESLVVLGLDAADYELVRKWDCENLLLSSHREIETFAHSIEVPSTLEVWPTIATGCTPTEHGVILHPEDQDRHPLYTTLVRANQLLPDVVRTKILSLKQETIGSSFPTTDHSHVFDSGAVYNWPGVTGCSDWSQESDWFAAVTDGEMTEQAFRQKQFGHAGKGVGWLAGQATAGVPIVGAHVHLLDHMGHIYASRPEHLRRAYLAVDSLVGWLREHVDRLVIVSDHGMQTTALDDAEPGVHSWRAMIATTESGPLPDHVVDIRGWLEERLEKSDAGSITDQMDRESTTSVDAPRQHLEDLGYL
ncbi:alkaline phosphatase family protein [Natronococcus wangiae]|uniref:alkaline phosphatase family protein n=1 Tax=Natronococcus wangiae TaxID=3068275 RepID=UPI00273EB71F|nr:alkaline phosphatase family protein [Natronococcus sp. AD5]